MAMLQSQQGDTASNAFSEWQAHRAHRVIEATHVTAGGSTAGGDISAGMRVPDRPSHPRQGNQGRQANSGGGPCKRHRRLVGLVISPKLQLSPTN